MRARELLAGTARLAPCVAIVVAIAGCGGAPKEPVPRVAGMKLADAKAALKHAGYDAEVDDQADASDLTEDDDRVCSTSPAAGRTGKGDTVEVLVESDAGDCRTRGRRDAAARPRARRSQTRAAIASASPGSRSTRTAAVALDGLPVKGRAPKTGYGRERFGDGWASVNGCDVRDRILRRDLRAKAYRAGTAGCEVLSGTLADPYTAARIRFVRGGASEVDIDHVVALGDAWQKGAQKWSDARRVAFANDALNLVAADAGANRQKGDGDAATWLPQNKAYRCDYVARQIAVKRKYRAWVTVAERDAMRRVLARCPRVRLPSRGEVRVPLHSHGAVVAPQRTSTPAPRSTRVPGARVFANCDAVRAAGLAPLHRGTAVYGANPRLDRDHDGLACE
jgi:Excalibur calcium-binding domain/Protein of unknown function (DUF1524)/PASTA domain